MTTPTSSKTSFWIDPQLPPKSKVEMRTGSQEFSVSRERRQAPEVRWPRVLRRGTVKEIADGRGERLKNYMQGDKLVHQQNRHTTAKSNRDAAYLKKCETAVDKMVHAREIEDRIAFKQYTKKRLPLNTRKFEMDLPEQITGGPRISTSLKAIIVPPLADVPARRPSFHGKSYAEKEANKKLVGENKHTEPSAKTETIKRKQQIEKLKAPSSQAPARRGSWHGQSENDGSGSSSQTWDPPMQDKKAERSKLEAAANVEAYDLLIRRNGGIPELRDVRKTE